MAGSRSGPTSVSGSCATCASRAFGCSFSATASVKYKRRVGRGVRVLRGGRHARGEARPAHVRRGPARPPAAAAERRRVRARVHGQRGVARAPPAAVRQGAPRVRAARARTRRARARGSPSCGASRTHTTATSKTIRSASSRSRCAACSSSAPTPTPTPTPPRASARTRASCRPSSRAATGARAQPAYALAASSSTATARSRRRARAWRARGPCLSRSRARASSCGTSKAAAGAASRRRGPQRELCGQPRAVGLPRRDRAHGGRRPARRGDAARDRGARHHAVRAAGDGGGAPDAAAVRGADVVARRLPHVARAARRRARAGCVWIGLFDPEWAAAQARAGHDPSFPSVPRLRRGGRLVPRVAALDPARAARAPRARASAGRVRQGRAARIHPPLRRARRRAARVQGIVTEVTEWREPLVSPARGRGSSRSAGPSTPSTCSRSLSRSRSRRACCSCGRASRARSRRARARRGRRTSNARRVPAHRRRAGARAPDEQEDVHALRLGAHEPPFCRDRVRHAARRVPTQALRAHARRARHCQPGACARRHVLLENPQKYITPPSFQVWTRLQAEQPLLDRAAPPGAALRARQAPTAAPAAQRRGGATNGGEAATAAAAASPGAVERTEAG